MASLSLLCSFFFFFKQKTAYEMRISDWSSDVCSSDDAGAWRIGAAGQFLDLADEVIAVARLVGDQLQQDEPQLAAVEHPAPAATFVPVVAESSAAAVTRPEDRKSTRLNSSH